MGVDARRVFEVVYAAHEPGVRAFVVRRLGEGGADDVVSEVFLAAWRRVEEMPSDPFPWLLGIARGALSNRCRAESRSVALVDRLARELEIVVPAIVQAPDANSEVFEALARLSESDQELLLLTAWEELSVAQIAAVLGVARGTVAVRLHRARRRLARVLDGGRQLPASAGESAVKSGGFLR